MKTSECLVKKCTRPWGAAGSLREIDVCASALCIHKMKGAVNDDESTSEPLNCISPMPVMKCAQIT